METMVEVNTKEEMAEDSRKATTTPRPADIEDTAVLSTSACSQWQDEIGMEVRA